MIAPSSVEQREIAMLLAQAFDQHPFFSLVYPEAAIRRQVLRSVFIAAVKDAARFGRIDVALRDKIVGAGINYPPGCYPLSFMRHLRLLPQYLRIAAVSPIGYVKLNRFQIGLNKIRPTQPHCYGSHLAGRQGEFIAGALMEPWLDECDANGWPCYLETHSRKLANYYGRLGFEVLRDGFEVFAGAPLTWTMWREPKRRP